MSGVGFTVYRGLHIGALIRMALGGSILVSVYREDKGILLPIPPTSKPGFRCWGFGFRAPGFAEDDGLFQEGNHLLSGERSFLLVVPQGSKCWVPSLVVTGVRLCKSLQPDRLPIGSVARGLDPGLELRGPMSGRGSFEEVS